MSEPKRLRKYLEAGDGCCNCEEYSIEGGPFEQDGMFVTQEVWCTACGAEWTSIFKLMSIRDFSIEETGMKTLKTQGNFVVHEGEVRRATFAMESDVRLFQSCNRLLAAAKRVIRNWEQGNLAAAVRYLDLSIKEIEDNMDGTPREVIVLIIEHRNGRNVYACESEDRAYDELYDFVAEYWSELPGDVGKIPSERLDAIEIYFQEKDGEESYEILTLPILSTKVEA